MSSYSPNLVKRAIELDLKLGDVVLGGRFKNQREVVESLGKDELGQPTYNGGKKLLAVRLEKSLPKDKWSRETKETTKRIADAK